ncbi:microcephalin isoform X2 [Esox lucius]|uniref:BRCT domain-containing protein n=2 Tax=Esox lucius TaxID=8010 RepID=A0A3P9AE79_ESOLU|nr:microcephalin isoform X2 [Esox lucius]XP_010887251.2 microcephalin isoform X2 [Esox lucius]
MTTDNGPNSATILKDVVAYVDVWSSSKTENYSRPFIHQLQAMGAEVSKTFNKHVTHVVFKNGHQATWNKAKKTGVRLVSVLWVARCKDDGEHVDEELCQAINDEGNPAFKKKAHRCMQPRDTPERTPENDRRMKKKLDTMIRDLVPKSPFITDVSPYIIDEENGIVYSPSLKRSDAMAQRLQEMREKRENLSPTDSQVVECRLSPEFSASFGETPSRSFFPQMDQESDYDLNASLGDQPGHCSNKEDGLKERQATSEPLDNKDFQQSQMSPCVDVAIQKTLVQSPLPESMAKEKESKQGKKSKRTQIKSDCLDACTEGSEIVRTLFTFDSSIVEKRSQSSRRCNLSKVTPPFRKSTTKQSLSESKPTAKLDTSCIFSHSSSSLAENPNVHNFPSLEIPTPKLKVGQKRKLSLPALAQSCTVSNYSDSCANDDDEVFEDFFSPANNPGKRQGRLLPSLSPNTNIPFELEHHSKPCKRKRDNMKTTRSDSASAKSGKHEVPCVNELSNRVNSMFDQRELGQLDTKKRPSSGDNNTKQTVSKRSRQSTLSFSSVLTHSTDELTRVPNEQNPSTGPTLLSESSLAVSSQRADKRRRSTFLPLHKNSHGKCITSVEIVGRGTENAPATVTDTISDNLSQQQRKVNVVDKRMERNTKTLRTLVMTSMSTEKQNTVTQVVSALGGFSVVDEVCESTTHVVSGGNRRTLNILRGIARGCWILSFEWILWCLEQGQWIPEEPYELSDQFPAAPICRLQQHLSAGEHQQDLFLGHPAMFVSRDTQPPAHSLVELIQLCGGTVCKTVRQAGLCIGEYHGKRPEGSRIVSEQWVLDCITHLKQLPYENYDLE